jgi:signal transduction histidine kinase
VAILTVVGSFGAASGQTDRRDITLVAVVLLLIAAAALAVRDRWPIGTLVTTIAAACVYIASGYPFGPIFLPVVVALFSAVQAGRRKETWAVAAAGYAGLFAALQVDERTQEVGWLHWALVAGWLVVILAVSELVRMQREQAAARARATEEARRRRVGEQRLGLAQELHDVLAHHLSLINVQASVALHLLDERPEQARPALTAIKHASHESLQDLRRALDTLRRGDDAPRTPAPGLADLDDLVDGVRASGLEVELARSGPLEALPTGLQLAAYRIVQEALTNVARHAQAQHVTVRVSCDEQLFAEVVDDGVGAPAPPGNGIVGMGERAAALGGTVDAGPLPGGGFRVVARLPVPS